jgi:hypothetical protein
MGTPHRYQTSINSLLLWWVPALATIRRENAAYLDPMVVVRFELFRVCALGSWVIGATMQCKLFVALQLEVAHHFIERCAGGRSRRSAPPATFGATKTPKTLLFNPHQFPAHGRLCRRALTLSDHMPSARRQGTKRSGSP